MERVTALSLLWLAIVTAGQAIAANVQKSYSPNVGRVDATNVYWGDTHVHTSLSVDAYIVGNRIGPQDAYRYAQGEVVVASNGMRAQ